MHLQLIELLCCPRSGQKLVLDQPVYRDGRIYSGWLVSESGANCYPIRNFIPRFVPDSNYADNFGMQWNKFRQTQLDSYSGHSISAQRFWKATGWRPADIEGEWVLDIGCGAGRFAEVAVQAGANLIALDYSSAVDACYENLKHHPNIHVVQGDIYALPFAQKQFRFVYSLGVLQHTPDVKRAFFSLPAMVARGGRLCVDFYWKRLKTMLHVKYLLRPITKHIPEKRLFGLLEVMVPILLPISQTVGRLPILGKALKRTIPVADYTGIFPLSDLQLKEWALLDTFDMFAPKYDSPQTSSTVRTWFQEAGFAEVDVFHGSHLVGRGCKT